MTIATTGLDVLEETRAFNEKLASSMASVPTVYDLDDPLAARGGLGVFPEPVLLAEGVDRSVPGRDGAVGVRVFTPEEVRGVYCYLHPGGRVLGSAHHQDGRLWRLATAARVAVVSVDYRLAPEYPHPASVLDCADVARWLVANAEREFGTDRLVIGGDSAGAELAVNTLLRLRDEGELHWAFVAAQLTYGVYDMSLTPSARAFGERHLVTSTQAERWFRAKSFPGLTPEQLREPGISPLYADLRDLPPARFAVGTNDPLLDDTLFMAQRWRAAGNEAIVEVVAEAVHGFTAFPITVARRELDRQHEYLAAAMA
ncbi:MAG TPA: alpha/beta hydrolase [Pseudonocardiaceae bacterium]|jgi:acetyl esterase/lipase|nr:alpha/beta hydrolase [Pseudonocardiaceae bacterium]